MHVERELAVDCPDVRLHSQIRDSDKTAHETAVTDLAGEIAKLGQLIAELESANQKEKVAAHLRCVVVPLCSPACAAACELALQEQIRKRLGNLQKEAAKAVADYDARMFELQAQCDDILVRPRSRQQR